MMKQGLFALIFALAIATPARALGPGNGGSSGGGGGSGGISGSGGNGIVVTGSAPSQVVSLPACTAAQMLLENVGATAFACATASGAFSFGATGVATLNAPYGATTYTA